MARIFGGGASQGRKHGDFLDLLHIESKIDTSWNSPTSLLHRRREIRNIKGLLVKSTVFTKGRGNVL